MTEELNLHKNIHHGLQPPEGQVSSVDGEYAYYHYGCDGLDDRVNIASFFFLFFQTYLLFCYDLSKSTYFYRSFLILINDNILYRSHCHVCSS